MRHLIFSLLLLFGHQGYTQSVKSVLKALESVNTEEDALSLQYKKKKWQISVQTACPTDLTFKNSVPISKICGSEVGMTFTEKPCDNCYTFVIKILSKGTDTALRCKYIYLDGSKLSMESIESKREDILTRYNDGTSFDELFKEYNMDGNPDGNFGWFRKHMAVEPFYEAVASHQKGDIFKIDVPKQKWYYVALKTHADTTVEMTKHVRVLVK